MCRSVKKALEVGLFPQLLKRMMGYWHIMDLRGVRYTEVWNQIIAPNKEIGSMGHQPLEQVTRTQRVK